MSILRLRLASLISWEWVFPSERFRSRSALQLSPGPLPACSGQPKNRGLVAAIERVSDLSATILAALIRYCAVRGTHIELCIDPLSKSPWGSFSLSARRSSRFRWSAFLSPQVWSDAIGQRLRVVGDGDFAAIGGKRTRRGDCSGYDFVFFLIITRAMIPFPIKIKNPTAAFASGS